MKSLTMNYCSVKMKQNLKSKIQHVNFYKQQRQFYIYIFKQSHLIEIIKSHVNNYQEPRYNKFKLLDKKVISQSFNRKKLQHIQMHSLKTVNEHLVAYVRITVTKIKQKRANQDRTRIGLFLSFFNVFT